MTDPTPLEVATKRLSRLIGASNDPKLSEDDLHDALSMFVSDDVYDIYSAAVMCLDWKLAAAATSVSFTTDGASVSLAELTTNLRALREKYNEMALTGSYSIEVDPYVRKAVTSTP